jgi:hypothetical protein
MPLLNEEGRFIATVTGAELGEAKTGTPYLQINFETDEGSIAGRVWLSDKAFDRAMETLGECFAFDGDFENLAQLKDKECSITTEMESWEDNEGNTKETLRVKWINPKGESNSLDPSARQSLAARLSAKAGKAVVATDGDEPF